MTPRQSQKVLLERVSALEGRLSADERLNVSELFRRNHTITRRAVKEGPRPKDEAEDDDAASCVDDEEDVGIEAPEEHTVERVPQTCEICFDMKEPSDLYDGALTNACGHESVICKGCLDTSIKSQLANDDWSNISCPFCLKLLPATLIEQHAEGGTLKK